jgi:hypothetical protein
MKLSFPGVQEPAIAGRTIEIEVEPRAPAGDPAAPGR